MHSEKNLCHGLLPHNTVINYYTAVRLLKTLFVGYVNTHNTESPISEHEAGDLCVVVFKAIITHSSPCVVVLDLKTSGITRPVMSSKSNRD